MDSNTVPQTPAQRPFLPPIGPPSQTPVYMAAQEARRMAEALTPIQGGGQRPPQQVYGDTARKLSF